MWVKKRTIRPQATGITDMPLLADQPIDTGVSHSSLIALAMEDQSVGAWVIDKLIFALND